LFLTKTVSRLHHGKQKNLLRSYKISVNLHWNQVSSLTDQSFPAIHPVASCHCNVRPCFCIDNWPEQANHHHNISYLRDTCISNTLIAQLLWFSLINFLLLLLVNFLFFHFLTQLLICSFNYITHLLSATPPNVVEMSNAEPQAQESQI